MAINGTNGPDLITGTEANDEIFGLAGDDTLRGLGGNDTLDGGTGNDTLTGGAGTDMLIGGGGSNIFFDTAAGLNGDRITDFLPGDRIQFTDLSVNNANFNLVGSSLTYNGGSIQIDGIGPGRFVIRAITSGGVEIRLQENSHNDVNGDGRSDFVVRDSVTGWLTNWVGTANGGFTNNGANASIQFGAEWKVGGIGDYNGDGREDFLLRRDDGWLTNWLATPTGGYSSNPNSTQFLTTDWKVVGNGDFNGDGRTDLLLRRDDGWLTNWLGTANGGFTSNGANTSLFFTTDWKVAGTGDFNGDGNTDMLLRRDDGWVTNWLGTDNGGFTNNGGTTSLFFTNDWKIIGTGDVNGDGITDMVLRRDDGWLTDWLGTQSGGFTNNGANTALFFTPDWKVSAIGDFNGDAIDDILLRRDDGWMTDWLGNSVGSFTNNGANFSAFIQPNWQIQDPFL